MQWENICERVHTQQKLLKRPSTIWIIFLFFKKMLILAVFFDTKSVLLLFTKPNFFFHFFWIFLLTMGCVVVGRELHQLTPKFKDKTENLRRRHRRHTHTYRILRTDELLRLSL